MQPSNITVLNNEQLKAVTGAGTSFSHYPGVIDPIWSTPGDSPFYIPSATPILFTA
ncbi:MAG: hypothetical protein HWE26_04005 [Alteromonadaceae bacterium]|nr:hypothetical protein [Alteromonadaceae bacterium]